LLLAAILDIDLHMTPIIFRFTRRSLEPAKKKRRSNPQVAASSREIRSLLSELDLTELVIANTYHFVVFIPSSRKELRRSIKAYGRDPPSFPNVVHFTRLFAGKTSFNEAIDGWDVSHVTTIADMFSGCIDFNQSLSS